MVFIMVRVKAKGKQRKYWIIAYAPELLGGTNKPLAKILYFEPEELINKIVIVKGLEFTRSFEDRAMNLYFRIIKVTPAGAYTTLIGHDYAREIITSKVRRRMSKVELITRVYTKDGHRVKVSILAMTTSRCDRIHKKKIRRILDEFVNEKAKDYTYEELIYNLSIRKTWHNEIVSMISKVYPIREFLIYKTRAETVIIPTDQIRNSVENKEEILKSAETFSKKAV